MDQGRGAPPCGGRAEPATLPRGLTHATDFHDDFLGPLVRRPGLELVGSLRLGPAKVPVHVSSDLRDPSDDDLVAELTSASEIARRLSPSIVDRLRRLAADEVTRAASSQGGVELDDPTGDRLDADMVLIDLGFVVRTVTLTWEAPRQLPGSWIAALCADDLAVLEVTIGRKRAST